MKKYILMGLLLFSIGAINAQIQVDSLIAKQKIKLHGYTLTGVSNDTDISHKDSSKVMSEAATKRIIENHVKDSILSVRGEAIVTVEGEHENPYSPWLAPIKTLNLHGNYIDSTGAIRLNAINGYWGDTVLNQASLLLAFANTDSSHNNRIALFPNTISTAPFDYVAYQSWVQDYVSTHGSGGSSFDTSKNQTITGNWQFNNSITAKGGITYHNPDQDVNNYFDLNTSSVSGGYDAQDGTQTWGIGTSGINLHSQQDDVFNVDASGNITVVGDISSNGQLSLINYRSGIATPNNYTTLIGAPSNRGDGNQIAINDATDAINFFCYDYNSTPTSVFNGNGGGSLARGNINWYSDGHIDIAEAIDLYSDGRVSFNGNKIYTDITGKMLFGSGTASISPNGQVSFDDDAISSNGIGDFNTRSLVGNSGNWYINDDGSFYFFNTYNGFTGLELTQDDGSIYFQDRNIIIRSDGFIGNPSSSWNIGVNGAANFANHGFNINGSGRVGGGSFDGDPDHINWWIGQDGQTRIGNALLTRKVLDGAGNITEQDFESPTSNKSIFKVDVDGTFSLGMQVVDDNPYGNDDGSGYVTHNYTNIPAISFDGSEVDFFEKHIWYTNGSFELNSNNVGINSDAINNIITIGDYLGDGQGTKIILDDNSTTITHNSQFNNFYGQIGIWDNPAGAFSSIYTGDGSINMYNAGNEQLITLEPDVWTAQDGQLNFGDVSAFRQYWFPDRNGHVSVVSYDSNKRIEEFKQLLPTGMTTSEINAISSPPQGLQVYNSTLHTICFYNGTNWQKVSSTNMN